MSEQEWFSKDFYKVLGVDKKADKKAITKAYRKLARQWHPDQNPGDKAAEAKFKEIGEAYAVLSNDEDRKRYDAIRAMAGGGARFSAGSGGTGGFEDLFGGFSGGVFWGRRPQRALPDLRHARRRRWFRGHPLRPLRWWRRCRRPIWG